MPVEDIKQVPSITDTRRDWAMLQARQDIYGEFEAERRYQDAQWGGPAHDDNDETIATFVGYICEYATGCSERTRKHDMRTRLVKAGALAVAALESFDRRQKRRERVARGEGQGE